MHGANLLFTLDIKSGYYNITLAKDSWKYNAFTTKYGKYELLQVPFRIHVALNYFIMMINETLKGLDFVLPF